MKLEDLLNKKILITLIKGKSKLTLKQKSCLVGLGLRGINSKTEIIASKPVIGMIKVVQHILKIN
jgi:ribosomal protein L30/L7E